MFDVLQSKDKDRAYTLLLAGVMNQQGIPGEAEARERCSTYPCVEKSQLVLHSMSLRRIYVCAY